MKATKDHISMETAKLFEECQVPTENCRQDKITKKVYPLYRWEEILWGEYVDDFRGSELLCYDCGEKVGDPLTVGPMQIGTGTCVCGRNHENNEPAYQYHSKKMIWKLQAGKYDLADEYFREHCVLV